MDDPHDDCSHWAGRLFYFPCRLDGEAYVIRGNIRGETRGVSVFRLHSMLKEEAHFTRDVEDYGEEHRKEGEESYNEYIHRTRLPVILFDNEELQYCIVARKILDKHPNID